MSSKIYDIPAAAREAKDAARANGPADIRPDKVRMPNMRIIRWHILL